MSQAARVASAGWLEGREHVLHVRIYYEDTDFAGAVYHGNYLRYFERGRSDFLRLIGVSHTELLEAEAVFTVVRIELDFQRPARIDDDLTVRTTFEAAKGPRLIVTQHIFRDTELIAQARVEVACIDLAGRARRPPATLTTALKPLLA